MISRSRSRHSRHGLVAVALELLLGGAQITITGAGAYMMIRGNMEWRDAQRELATAGYSLNIQQLTRAAVPDAENFGATPALKGIATRAEDQTPEIKAKLERLKALDPAPSSVRATASVTKPDISLPRPVDWKGWRAWLAGPRQWNVPEDEPDDAKAVASALAKQEPALVEEFLRAARRPRAQFLPRESQRIAESLRRGDLVLEFTSPGHTALLAPCRFFALQIEASHAAGNPNLLSRNLPVMISLARMPRSESTLIGLLVAVTMNNILEKSAGEWMREHRVSAADLAMLQEALAGPDGARGLRQALHMELLFFTHLATTMMEQGGDFTAFDRQPEMTPLEASRSAAVARIIMPGNMAAVGRLFLKNATFLERDDWAGMLAESKRYAAEQKKRLWLLDYRTMLAEGAYLGYGGIFSKFAEREFHRRLFIAACALERWRLEGRELPDALAELPPRLLPEVPRDIDGQPLRYIPTPEGFVVWSVGLNLKDDWHGAPPPDDIKDIETKDQPDWQIRVP